MTLSAYQLWSLVLVVPALVSGVVSATVAFLLARLNGQRVFHSFGMLTFTFTAFGFLDGVVSWMKPDMTSPWFLTLGFADAVLTGFVVLRLADFTEALTSRPWGQVGRILFLVPLAGVIVLLAVVLSTLELWTFSMLLLVGHGLLAVVFVAALVCGIRLVTRWRDLHDRIFRRILVGTGVLLLAFVPLWFWDVFGRVGFFSFYWFFLLWNLGALTLASRAFFEPASPRPDDVLFTPAGLEACTRRFGLTPRETEIAGLHAQGFAARDIGARLFIAPKTVRNHISNLYEKTGTGQRRELLDLLRSGR